MNTSASSSATVSEVSEFGKDHGLIHEVVVTGRKVGAGATFWSLLAHNENLFSRIVREVVGMFVATHPFDLATFIGNKWSLVADEHDARCDALTEVDFSKVGFETYIKEGESCITGEEKLTRFKASGKIRLGSTVFMGLWKDYTTRKENSVLEQLYREQKITYMDFFGDVLLDPHGGRRVLFLCRRDAGDWYWDCYWLPCGWGAGDRSASLAS